MHHLSSRDVTRKMVPRSPSDSPASLKTSSIGPDPGPEISDHLDEKVGDVLGLLRVRGPGVALHD